MTVTTTPRLNERNARALLAGLQSGEITVADVAEACLARVAARDGDIRAWKFIDPAQVRAEAARLDALETRGPLHGLPIGVKDVILTKDMPTTYNSPQYEGSQPGIDAACIATLRAAGALIIGKCDTVEFAAMGHRALTRNPHDLSRTPGGSSSGSAAAVADFHVPLTLATQTGGSTLRPASFCGVYAMKPTWNAVSREGLKMYSATCDTLGWYARSVDDLALLAEVFDLEDDPAFDAPANKPLRLAYTRSPSWLEAEPAMQHAFEQAIATLRAAGHHVEELPLPSEFDALCKVQEIVMLMEGQPAMLSEFRQFGDALHPDFERRLHTEITYTKADLRRAWDQAAAARPLFDRLAAPFDAVLTPSAAGVATPGLEGTGSANFNRIWTLLHAPCVGLPLAVPGLPLGITLTGPRFSDRRVLRAAAKVAGVLCSPASTETSPP